jgi:hypothetical protein
MDELERRMWQWRRRLASASAGFPPDFSRKFFPGPGTRVGMLLGRKTDISAQIRYKLISTHIRVAQSFRLQNIASHPNFEILNR